MLHNTPNRKSSDFFMEPIFFETPRIRKFYEKNSDLSDEKPYHQGHMIFTLMSSPADPHSMAKRNMIMRKTMDIFSEGIEYVRNYDKQEEDHITTPREFIRQRENTTANTVSYTRRIDHESDKTTTVCSQLISDFNTAEISDHDNDHADEEREEREERELDQNDKQTEEIFKFGRVEKDAEVRKRKRKSTQQLKILKVEFEKDDAWDKEKIMNVAKITGLTESQVYKWCWDQKKKTDTITIDKLKFDIFDDKENISPKGGSSVLPRSKNISKLKKGKPFNSMRATQKSKNSAAWEEEDGDDDEFYTECRPFQINF